MESGIIKSFLVGLGFDVDEKSLKKFNDAIKSATIKVAALYGSIQIAATGIFAAISGTAKGFEEMGYQLRIVAPAMNRWLVMRQAMLEAYSKAGVNLAQVVKQSILFNYALAKTKFALEAVYKSVAAKFFPLLTKQLDIFRLKIFANMPKIQAALVKFVEFIFKAFKATTQLGSTVWSILTRVYDFFEKLHKATSGWSTIILGVVAAWQLLNLSFLATPLGMLLAGLTAILALYDDFKVWQEGGKSFFDWGSEAVTTMVGLATAIGGVVAAVVLFNAASAAWAVISAGVAAVMAVLDGELTVAAIALAIIEAPVWAIVGAISALLGVLTLVDSKWGVFGGALSGALSGLGQGALNLLGGGGGAVHGGPLLPQGSSSNANISQQTHITVNGAADANQVGKNVAGSQDRVNFDMTRNMKGALR